MDEPVEVSILLLKGAHQAGEATDLVTGMFSDLGEGRFPGKCYKDWQSVCCSPSSQSLRDFLGKSASEDRG